MISDFDVDACGEALRGISSERLEKAARQLGVVLTPQLAAALLKLGAAHWREVLLAIHTATHEPAGIALRDTRETNPAAFHLPKAIFVAVKLADRLAVGAQHHLNLPMNAGDAWPGELKPWFKKLEKNRARLETWAANPGDDRLVVPLAPQAAPAIGADPVTAKLLAAVIAEPDEDTPRLVYGDHLLARGDARGEYIQLACELERQPKGEARDAVAKRVAELEQRYSDRLAGEIAERCDGYELKRGFVAKMTLTAGAFYKHGERLLASSPIDTVQLKPVNDESVKRLAEAPALAKVRRLSLAQSFDTQRFVEVAPLGESPHLANIEALDLEYVVSSPAQWQALFEKLSAPALRELHLRYTCCSPRALIALVGNESLGALRRLDFTHVDDVPREWVSRKDPRSARLKLEKSFPKLLDDAMKALAGSTALRSLSELALTEWLALLDSHVAVLFSAKSRLRLQELDLDSCRRLTDAALMTIAGSPRASTLRVLNVTGTNVTAAGIEAVLRSPHLGGLEELKVWLGNRKPEEHARIAAALLAVPRERELRRIFVASNHRIDELNARFPPE